MYGSVALIKEKYSCYMLNINILEVCISIACNDNNKKYVFHEEIK